MLEGGDGDFFDGEGFHATEVDGTFAEEAGVAFDMVTKDGGVAAEGAGQFRRGGTEEDDLGDVEGGGEMHGAGVVGDEEPAGFEEDAEFHEGGLAGDFDDGVGEADEIGDFVNQLGVTGAADEEDPATGGGVEAAGDFGESFRRPAFGGAVFGSGI